jgi:acetylornithine deacetylase
LTSLFSLIRELVDIPSVTGEEEALARFLEKLLADRGFRVRLQEVEPHRFNVLALAGGRARVVLCTHLDTVKPFIPSSEDDTFIYGRGACDAKGIMGAMVTAAEALRQEDRDEVGLLFVVGEEVDSIGARHANDLALESEYVVVGEPTENRLATGHRGALEFVLHADGTAAHSAYPERGDSAIDRLLAVLQRIRRADWGTSTTLGTATVNIGTLTGGVAGNVIAPWAEAGVLVRVVGTAAHAQAVLDELIAGDSRLTYRIVTASDAVSCLTLDGFETAPVAFGSDIPSLTSLGRPLMVGPGSIHDAHRDDEKLDKRQALDGVQRYRDLVTRLLEPA